MKVSNRLIAGLGILMISATTLAHAAGPDQRDGHDNRGPDNHQDQNQGRGNDHGNDHRPDEHRDTHGGGRPPQNFDDVRRQISEHRDVIGRGQPLPSNIHVVRGHPLPRGYGKRLDSRSLQYLPRYDGYEWRRLGPDVVLIAVGTGIVYEILDGVLN